MPGHILIIDDNADNLELMRYLLAAYGYRVSLAETGAEGLRLAAAQCPDLILCDIQLPGMDGLAVARAVHADPRLCDIPLVEVTAQAMVGDRDRILASGFAGYIDKPIAPESFVSAVEVFLPDAAPGFAPPDKGTTSSTRTRRPRSPKDRGGGGRRILMLDDHQDNLELTRILLEAAFYTVETALSFEDALKKMEDFPPELILSDVNMPRDDGFALLSRVRADARLRDVPFAFVSASNWTDPMRDRAMQLGADHFFERPSDFSTLCAEIERCLRARH
jgi:two-component system, cell cycle response regulator